jgi:hypothetical protein
LQKYVNISLVYYEADFGKIFIRLRNHHYAAAVGSGLFSKGVPCQLNGSLVGTLLNPTNNFAALKAHEDEAPGLPHIFPLIDELQQSGNKEEQLLKTFQFIKVFGGDRTAYQVESEEEEEGSERGGKETRCGDSGSGQIRLPSESPVQRVWKFFRCNHSISYHQILPESIRTSSPPTLA